MPKFWILLFAFFFAVPAFGQDIALKIDDDPYSQGVIACTPQQGGRNILRFETQTTQLCGVVLRGKAGPPLVSFTFYHNYDGDWIDYSSATMLGGGDLETRVRRNVGTCRTRTIFGGGCSLSESVSITIPNEKLSACASSGLSIKVWGGRPIELFIGANECAAILSWLKSRREVVLPQ